MQGHLIGGILVDALNDINFAMARPVGAEHPERRPGAAGASRHVGQIQDHQALVVAVLAGQTDAVATVTAGNIVVVHADIDGATGGTDQAVRRGGRVIDIIHVTVGGVGFLKHQISARPGKPVLNQISGG